MKKRFTLVLVTLLAFTGLVNASTSWSNQDWSSSPKAITWENPVTLLDKNNEAIAIGDVITVTFAKTTPSQAAQVVLSSVYTNIVSKYYGAEETPSELYSIVISARERDVFRRYGMNLTGDNITVTAVTKTTPGTYSGGNNSIWVGSTSGWSSDTEININDVLQKIKAGDRFVVNMSKTGSGDNFTFGYVASNWTNIPFDASSYSKSDTRVELIVTSTIAANIRAGKGIYLDGNGNYTYTSIEYIPENQTEIQTYAPSGGLTFLGDTNFEIPIEYFNGRKEGDKMIVTVTDISGTAPKGGTDLDKDIVYHRLMLSEQNWDWIGWIRENIDGTGNIEITITDQMLKASKTLPIHIAGSNCIVSQIQFKPASVDITVSDANFGTYSCEQPLDFTGLAIKAYVASDVAEGVVTLSEITQVPANTGIMVYAATADTYEVPVATSAPSAPAVNFLIANQLPTSIAASTTGTYNYIFAKDNSSNVGFFKLTAAHTLRAHKAYLHTTTDFTPTLAPMLRFEFDEESNATNLEDVKQTEEVVKFWQDGKLLILRDGVTYDVMGRVIR